MACWFFGLWLLKEIVELGSWVLFFLGGFFIVGGCEKEVEAVLLVVMCLVELQYLWVFIFIFLICETNLFHGMDGWRDCFMQGSFFFPAFFG